MAKRKRATTADAVQILYRRYYEGRPDRVRGLEEARANDSVARKLVMLRLQAGSAPVWCFLSSVMLA